MLTDWDAIILTVQNAKIIIKYCYLSYFPMSEQVGWKFQSVSGSGLYFVCLFVTFISYPSYLKVTWCCTKYVCNITIWKEEFQKKLNILLFAVCHWTVFIVGLRYQLMSMFEDFYVNA